MLKVVKRLLDTGVSLQNIRVAVDHLRDRGIEDLAGITLFSDGTTVYECTSAEEIVDLLQGGQGVFGIAVGGTMREMTGQLAEFPGERISADEARPRRPPPPTSCPPGAGPAPPAERRAPPGGRGVPCLTAGPARCADPGAEQAPWSGRPRSLRRTS